MLFNNSDRWNYTNSQLHEVICQIRFPAILSINEASPAEFQEAIRDSFPRYEVRKEQGPPRLVGMGTAEVKLERPPVILNHTFESSTGIWKINLTQNFISISTIRYNNWEDMAKRLDKPLAEFIRIYQPSYFERLGLRYVNVFSRKTLNLEGTPWREMFNPAYLGVLSDPEVDEGKVRKSSNDTELTFGDSTFLKLHAGPGMLKQGGQTDPEVKFILDMDCSTGGQIEGGDVAAKLDLLHGHASDTFHGAITETLHNALGANAL